MNDNDNANDITTSDEERFGQSPESSLRVEPSVTGVGESGSSRTGHDRGEVADNAPEVEDRSDASSVREAIAEQLVIPIFDSSDADSLPVELEPSPTGLIRQSIEFSEQTVSSAENNIRRYLNSLIDNVDQSISYCDNCIKGCFGRICDKADTVLAKCEKKIVNRIDDSIANSYYFTYNFFGPPPTIEEVITDLGISADYDTKGKPPKPIRDPKTGLMKCPVGYEPFWNEAKNEWECVLACPEGYVREPISRHCFPIQEPIKPEPPPKEPTCPVEYPPVPGLVPPSSGEPPKAEPPCPPPSDLICPPGQIPSFVNGRWKCVPIKDDPGIGGPKDKETGICFSEQKKEPCVSSGDVGFLDFLTPDWNRPDVCEILDSLATNSPTKGKKLADMIPWRYDPDKETWIVPDEIHEAVQGMNSIARSLILGAGGALVSAVDAIAPVIPKIAGCDVALMIPFQIIDSLLDLIEKYTGFKSNALSASIQFVLNYICPSSLPSQGELNQIYYAGQISETTWKCLTRAIGNYDHWARLVRDVNRPQLTPDELVVAYFRGLINKQTLESELTTRYGFSSDVAKNYEQLKATLPGIGDLIRFMVRDVEDKGVYETYKYDEGFTKKFDGKIKQWASYLGIPQEVFLYFWRAHWELPSPTQLYEMLRRLREDSLDPEARKLAVTRKDVADALAANDIPEFWRERLMAISYLPMTLSDAKTAYIEGAIDEQTFRSVIRDSGRNEQHTQWIFELTERQKSRRTMNLIGGFSAKKVTEWFKIGAIDDAMARRLYLDAGLTEEMAERAIRIARTAIRSERIENRIKVIKKRYLVGDLSSEQARAMLIKIGAELNRVNEMIEDWELEIQIRSKQIAAGVLCSWYYRKLITEDEYAIRLRRIGYQPADVERIITECSLTSAEKAFDRKVKTKRGLKALQEKPKPQGNGKKPK